MVLLLSTLILAGALAYQAIDSVASHRATAESVLNDYAAFAAEQYAGRVSQDLQYYGIYPALTRLVNLHLTGGTTGVPTRVTLGRNANQQLEQSLELVGYTFRFDPQTGVLVTSPDARYPPAGLGDSLAAHARDHYDTTATSAMAVLDDGSRLRFYIYTLYRDPGTGPVGLGFEADGRVLADYFTNALRRGPLLPPTLVGGVSVDSLLSVRIRTAGGTQFLDLAGRTAPAEPRGYFGSYGPTAYRSLPAQFGGLSVIVSLDPAVADVLVIGGVPSSRLPYILGLFLLTAGLIVAALMQFRREQELDRLRTEFISNVSHELRTPLAQIRMFAETLLLGRVRSDEERGRSLAIIDKETRRLTHLVENVLLFSQSERRAVRLEQVVTDLPTFLQEVVDMFRPLAAARGTSLTVRSEPIRVHVDRGALQQIVLNLLDNAVKYGPEEQRVLIEAELHIDLARITVEDEGPGVPEADRNRVWERFSRLDRERDSSIAGAGIGLAVVRELTKLHGGRAFVENGKTGGARFVVELPGASLIPPTSSSPDAAPQDAIAGSPEP